MLSTQATLRHVGSPKNDSRAKYYHAQRNPKLPKKNSQNIRFRSFQGPSFDVLGCLLWTWEFIGKESHGLKGLYGFLYVHFEAMLDFTRNKKWLFRGFLR